MLYFEIVLQVVAICAGTSAIYKKKVLEQEYKQDELLLLALAIFFSKDSQSEIIQWLAFGVALIILFIIFDKVIVRIRNKG